MRRLMLPAVIAGAIAAPIPVVLAQGATGLEFAEHATQSAKEKAALRKEARAAKRAAERRVAERRQAATYAAVAVPPHLEAIAQCESGGNPAAVSADGTYHGKFQFSIATWQAMGGSGLPSQAPEAEQDMRAAMLYAQSGPGQWPVCGS